ncbi:MAG: hypothetical protein A3F41_00475 [Coxiella sp. RIFCSPHIGHO2_12_FULL_44_14]|nr:MAG: hypothetical protein A3F41_00475 [Coxiella sp. RIFCSPHIGHO2_12_FULL_44_14]
MLAIDHDKILTEIGSSRPIDKIAILIAMPEEAAPVIETLSLYSCDAGFDPHLGLQSYKSSLQNKEIYLIVNGVDSQYGVARVGTEAATLAAHETIRILKPDTIISAGTAGGYANRGAAIGDIYIGAKKFSFHDRRIPIEKYEDYCRGNYPCLEAPALASAFNFKTGLISTGNSLSINADEQALIDQSGAVAKEMEVAAIAHVARLYQVRVMAVKAITNLADIQADAASEFEKNFTKATQNLANALPNILNYLLGKTPKQLQTSLSIINPNPFLGKETAARESTREQYPCFPSKR